MSKLVIANWKAAPATLEAARELASQVAAMKSEAVVICPPMPFLEEVSKEISGSSIVLGAQDIAPGVERGQTGEETADMLVGLGVRYVIVGHSERRWKLGESEEIIRQKINSALAADIIPVICLGEKTRDAGWEDFLRAQTKSAIGSLGETEISACMLAYEPAWAISTNPGAQPDTAESAARAVQIILEEVSGNPKIVYGGSVTQQNAGEFLSHQAFDGVLVGGVSLDAGPFSKIVAIANEQ